MTLNRLKIMKLEDLVDIVEFEKSMIPPDRGVFWRWSQTAHEILALHKINNGKWKDIERNRQTYESLADSELTARRMILFVEELLQVLQTDENKKSLIKTEAFKFKTFI